MYKLTNKELPPLAEKNKIKHTFSHQYCLYGFRKHHAPAAKLGLIRKLSQKCIIEILAKYNFPVYQIFNVDEAIPAILARGRNVPLILRFSKNE